MQRSSAVRGVLLSLIVPVAASAQWQFDKAIDVAGAAKAGIFHHVDSAGRRNVAVQSGTVAVAWEDNRSGKPAVYVAFKRDTDQSFSEARLLSGGGDAFEPAVEPVAAGFLIAWEEDGKIAARYVRPESAGETAHWGGKDSTQVALCTGPEGEVLALWSEHAEGGAKISASPVTVRDGRVNSGASFKVDIKPFRGDQNYPSCAWHTALGGYVAAWEDRRYGNVILFSAIGNVKSRFSLPMQINELRVPQSGQYGVASGSARVALAPYAGGVVAVWSDKRNFRFGYDIFAAYARNSGRFGENSLVQDGFAEGYEQWHPAVAARGETVVVAWDDDRDGTSDIWLSHRTAEGWSDDYVLNPAAGPAQQTHPSIALDENGDLHAVWIQRESSDGPTVVRYARGRHTP